MCLVVHATNRDRNIQVHYTINTMKGGLVILYRLQMSLQCDYYLGCNEGSYSKRCACKHIMFTVSFI